MDWGLLLLLTVMLKGEAGMSQNGIFCLEGMWDNDLKNKMSIIPLLNMLEINAGIKYIHHDVATVEELEFYLRKWKQARYRNYPVLYLAFHGDDSSLLINGKEYPLLTLSEKLRDHCRESILLMASCSTLRTDTFTVKQFLKNTGALAICGYNGRVSWMIAAAFELLVLSAIQTIPLNGRNVYKLEKTIQFYGSYFKGLDYKVYTRRILR